MNLNKVVFLKISKVEKEEIQKIVRKSMALGEWKKYIYGNKIFLKVNGVSDQLVPGQCTSPWVLEAVLQEVTENYPNAEISVGDADLAATKQLDTAARIWLHKELAEKYGGGFVNLSKDPTKRVEMESSIMREIHLPVTLLDADSILNIPVMKSHCMSKLTCCLKNHWGMVPRFRHNLHPVYDQFISDMNKFFTKTRFNVVDGTVSMEWNAPRTGIPKICNVIFSGHDRVAIDYTVARYMGFDPQTVKHIWTCERDGVGSTKDIEIIGDKFEVNPFVPPEPDKQPIFFWETRLRKVPLLKPIIFDSPLFWLFAGIATAYNTKVWYNLHGTGYMKKILETPYATEFKPLFDREGIKL